MYHLHWSDISGVNNTLSQAATQYSYFYVFISFLVLTVPVSSVAPWENKFPPSVRLVGSGSVSFKVSVSSEALHVCFSFQV